MALPFLVLVLAVFFVAGFGAWVWSLVDALSFTDAQWAQAGQNKLLWVLLIVVLALLGSLLYVLMVRPALTQKAPA